jgi:hypothetical protein
MNQKIADRSAVWPPILPHFFLATLAETLAPDRSRGLTSEMLILAFFMAKGQY